MPEYLFVTGKLAADALRATLERAELGFAYEVAVLDVSVAGLLRPKDIARRLDGSRDCARVMVPGLCRGDLGVVEAAAGVPAVRGPKDLKDLPVFFGGESSLEGYGESHVRILAEIVEAWRLPWERLLAEAEYYRAGGADIIDLGCPPMEPFEGVGDVVRGLKELGYAVSVDTFDPGTIREADEAGVDLLLSVNSQNLVLVPELRCKVVVIPDFGEGLDSLERNAAKVAALGKEHVLDPILDPLSFGFTAAVERFCEVRRRHPEAEILMGVGNLTELTDVDSHGVNAVMAGIITELGIDYVLTTEVVSWARGAVRELDRARKLMFYAHSNRVLPKSLDDGLVALKSTPFDPYTEEELRAMQAKVRDRNLRIFADLERVYLFNRDLFVSGTDPGELFAAVQADDPGHAFYLGRELERAALAVRLGKRYTQESDLGWGYLSEDGEPS